MEIISSLWAWAIANEGVNLAFFLFVLGTAPIVWRLLK